MKESDLQAKCMELMQDYGFYTINVIQAGKAGVSDIIACAPDGIFWSIEVKLAYNKASELQLLNLEEVEKRGGIAKVIFETVQLEAMLKARYKKVPRPCGLLGEDSTFDL